MLIPFLQNKQFNYTYFQKYIEKASNTNQWSNGGYAAQCLEERARELLQLMMTKQLLQHVMVLLLYMLW